MQIAETNASSLANILEFIKIKVIKKEVVRNKKVFRDEPLYFPNLYLISNINILTKRVEKPIIPDEFGPESAIDVFLDLAVWKLERLNKVLGITSYI